MSSKHSKSQDQTKGESGRPAVFFSEKYGLMFGDRFDDNKGHMKQRGISPRECAAMRLLYRDGWTKGTLAMCFELASTWTVTKHLKGECDHNLPVPTVHE